MPTAKQSQRWRIWLRYSLRIATAAAMVYGLTMFAVVYFAFSTACVNESLQDIPSPDGQHRVVIFQRDCGATTGFSTQASLLSEQQALNDRSANLFIADTNHGAAPSGPGGGPAVNAVWLDAQHLQLSHHPNARIFLATPQLDGVQIKFLTTVARPEHD
ncbi:MAG: DUF5412 family protein [Nevskia sp.]|uniref:DUF5412 family protein n=1 Tax=Nevskia sp. TaxID=1929292 RepID=UPI0040359815